jgi:haloalkane dehalogenase
MKILRTPEERFLDLPDYPFEPHYVDVDDLRMHYVDEGPANADPALLLHGEPSSSYLYRHMIPPIAAAGIRAIAPDFTGFGKSDKLASQHDYSYERHVRWMRQFMERLDLRNITLVGQDWGALIGLRLVAENEDRFDRVVLANGTLPTGDREPPRSFRIWRAFARFTPWFPPRAFPKLVPTRRHDPAAPANRAAWKVLGKWQKPFLTAFSNRDPIMRGLDKDFLERVPGAKDQPHATIRNAGHFLQEDKGPELAKVIIDFIRNR